MLAQSIVRDGGKAVAAALAPLELRRGVGKAVTAVVEELQRRSKPITTQAETA